MNDSPGALEILSTRVDELEKRVHALEHPIQSTAVEMPVTPPHSASTDASVLETGSIFPIIGRAALGIAGAYVLRALAESRTSAKLAVSATAVTYAFAWLLGSDRAFGRVARTLYAVTSALILAPMLWENTLVFHVFTPMITAGVLASFLTLAATLDLRKPGTRSMAAAQSIALVTASALAFATHEVVPFIAVLLIAVFISEFARTRDLAQPVWILNVLVADITIWGAIFIYSGPPETRASYRELNPAFLIAASALLFALNVGAVSIRVFVRDCTITVLETIQLVIAFALAASAVLYFAPLHVPTLLGATSLALSAAGYSCAFYFLRARNERRSFRIFSLWSAALLMAGALWALPHPLAAIFLATAAAAATYLANRTEPKTLQFHGALFLFIAALLADLPQYLYACLAATPPPHPTAPILVVVICAALATGVSIPPLDSAWMRALYLLPPLIAISALTALLAHGVLSAAAALMSLEPQHIAILRTLAISVAALAIAFGGSHFERNALTRFSYLALAFLAAKLLFEDLRHGHLGFIAASIGLFAITLMVTPKLVRMGSRRQTPPSSAALLTRH
jgi:hypothetical protein